MNNFFKSWMPSGFMLRLTFLNILVIVVTTAVSGWAIYHAACFLVAGVGDLDAERQQQFNHTLYNYIWVFMISSVLIGSILHFYLTRRLIRPIRKLIESTEQLKLGKYPEPVEVYNDGEVGQLAVQFNELISQLQTNEQQREKFITDLSHEIRTPISNLNGYLLALRDGAVKGNQTLFDSLYQESNRLSKLIEQIEQLKDLDELSTQSFVKKELHELSNILSQSVAMFERTWRKDHIPIQLKAESCKKMVHRAGIQQVISNILDNANRYYKGTGPIKLIGKNQKKGYFICISGPGEPIPAEERKNIFKRFYRLDSSRSRATGGSGLGLAISLEIVERHHQGKIGVTTNEDGNSFWILLP